MTPERRQRLLLGILAVLTVIAAGRYIGPLLSDSSSAGAGGGGRSAASRSAGGAAASVEPLDLESLEQGPATYTPGRDPFRYGPAEVVAAPRPAPRPMPTAPPPVARPVDTGPPLPAVDLVYLGNFGPNTGPIAVFSDRDSIYNARVGDVIKEKFKLVQVGYESADLAYVDFPEAPAKRLEVGG